MKSALNAWLAAASGGRRAAARAAAEAVATDPWTVVSVAGRLARCGLAESKSDIGITERLTFVGVDSSRAIVRVPQGAPIPVPNLAGRRRRGAWDSGSDLAMRAVDLAMGACQRRPSTGMDPACGTGAFLVAMQQRGLAVVGRDIDPVALEVARIAAPGAVLFDDGAFADGEQVDIVATNPPFVSPEHQDKSLRRCLRQRYPWLTGRFDLAVPLAARAVEWCRVGGGVALVVPNSLLVQPYGAPLRRDWLARHQITALTPSESFSGAAVHVQIIALSPNMGPEPLPPHDLDPAEVLRLPNAPMGVEMQPGDVALVEQIRSVSVTVGDLSRVDTGVVSHGPLGGKARLLHDLPGPGRVPYADAKEFFQGARRWLDYRPEEMHRAKHPSLFESPKIVLQRIRGGGRVRALVDREGIYVGHTCTVVVPNHPEIDLDRLAVHLRSAVVDGVTTIERGRRLDLYPRDVAGVPVPRSWLENQETNPILEWGLSPTQVRRLEEMASH